MQPADSTEQSTSDTAATALPGAAPSNAFVINLCSSTSPVALTPPDHAGLKRFSFFVSRRREEQRERFRLHMGYFDTQEEAEKLLDIVREIYPGAWAGLAPGQRLRSAVAAVAAPALAREVAPAELPPPDCSPIAAGQAMVPASLPSAVATAEHAIVSVPAAAADVSAATTAVAESLTLLPDAPRALPEHHASEATAENEAAARSLSDVRAAIASLDDTSERTPVLKPIPELKPAPRAQPAKSEPADPISDHKALAVLEQGAAQARERAGAAEEVQPQTEKPYYAVQLMWSVQPLEIAQVPQLAIFSAYTLYGAEGNRDGRRWYGLRLGFFTDAVSAKQVAHYVRSEFSTVSVVPVTARERERAKLAAGRPAAEPTVNAGAPTAAAIAPMAAPPATPGKTEFEFIEDRESAAAARAKTAASGARAPRAAPGKRAKLRTQGAVQGRAKTKPLTLEETLEILGAGELKMDDGRTPLINESGSALSKAKSARAKSSRLGRLFDRLSERMGN
ncbi:MAG TPA: hypothetical protein VGF89_03605 [Steroidobacteraceae bacterium]|jgi:hypothetical protein